jgi:hypothetical protein
MFTYQQVKAVREQRFQRYIDKARARERRSSHWELRDLLGALSKKLDDLGFRDNDGESFPARPAY